MASAAGSSNRVVRVAGSALLPLMAYGAYKGNAVGLLESFFTGPGRTSRIVALVVVLVNWKSLPLAWTFRVFHAMASHFSFRSLHTHTPDKLFHPVITPSHVSLLEVDYNIHKSNSTYFADLDVSRSHLIAHLFARGCQAIANNAKTTLVLDPSDPTKAAKGRFGVMLGAVHCSFKKELQPYQRYEMWSRVLSWDRKWIYIVTHFVEKGAVQPRSWDASSFGATRKGSERELQEERDWEKKIHATAISKYVFKVGRLTVHPAILIEASGMLPERPGGWVAVEDGMAQPSHPVNGSAVPEAEALGWDWRRTEEVRQKGHEFAEHFAALDGLLSHFDAGENGALGKFGVA
ncbi:capsule polysaccharide biosynthesis protein [Hypoxylon sp. FL1284]|nr:capsule polysaccharide biosynthesis protein [Hypoxylon sp. FL1284]